MAGVNPYGYHRWFKNAILSAFKGIDVTDPELGLLPGTKNMTSFGDTGIVCNRWGTTDFATVPGTASHYIFFSQVLGKLFSEEGTTLAVYDKATASRSTVTGTLASSSKAPMVEFNGAAYINVPTDTVYHTDGSTKTAPSFDAGHPGGKAIAVWQNKVWASDNGGKTVYWSNAGDGTTWTTSTDFVSIRETDDPSAITAMGVGQGMDVIGRAGLLVFCARSAYRITDSSTGAYITIDDETGVPGPEAVASDGSIVMICNRRGVFEMKKPNGPGAFVMVSQPIQPLWDRGSADWDTNGDHYIATYSAGSFYFSNGATLFELNPRTGGWFVHAIWDGSTEHTIISASAAYGTGSTTFYDLMPAWVLIDNGTRIVRLWEPATASSGLVPLTDYAGSSPTCIFVSPWVGGGLDKIRIRRLVIEGCIPSDGQFGTYLDMGNSRNVRTMPSMVLSGTSSTRLLYGEIHSLGAPRSIAIDLRSSTLSNYTFTDPSAALSRVLPGFQVASLRFDMLPQFRG